MLRLPSFRYLQPRTLAEALRMKGDAGRDGMFVAGGTDLYPNMKRRHQEPKTVISLMGVPELNATEGRNDGMTVGSCLTLSQLSVLPSFRHRISCPPRLHTAAPQHGHTRRQPVPRYALQLLQPELRVAEVDRLLHEKGRPHLLGGAVIAALLGGQLVRRRAGDGRNWGRVSARRATGGARGAGGAVLSQRRNQLPHEATGRDSGGRAPAEAERVGRRLSQTPSPRVVRLPRARRCGVGSLGR